MKNENSAIKVENISKIYRIGVKNQEQDTFAGSLFAFFKSPLHNYRTYRSYYRFIDIDLTDMSTNHRDDIIWAVKGVSFEIKEGQVVGLIGGNGAGKSTLLKILAKITDPTSGRATIRGRVSSLLEVGTGFHQELTGRENVFLNGAVLGMTKKEITRKFDEIVDFSGVEKFIDTPVKRYSSGMKVRLAFSVAACMEPEILLVDEVLAVGDAAFQSKCLGKMSDVSQQGRTIIFVSHNMPAILNLCERVILLESGAVKMDTDPDTGIKAYFESSANPDGQPVTTVQSGGALTVRIGYRFPDIVRDGHFGLNFETLMGVKIFYVHSKIQSGMLPDLAPSGVIECRIPCLPLLPGSYYITPGCGSQRKQMDFVERCFRLQVTEANVFGTGRMLDPRAAIVFVDADWQVLNDTI
jgi:lipopolysaccharide transport system ATP-binding protein